MTANGMARARQRPRLDLPGSAPAARRSVSAKPIMMAVSAMLDMTTEMTQQMIMKPRITLLTSPFTRATILAMRRWGNVDWARNVVKPKMPTNIQSAPVNVAAQMALYDAMPSAPHAATITSDVMGSGSASVAHITTAATSTMMADCPSRDRSGAHSGPTCPMRISTMATAIHIHLNRTLLSLACSAMGYPLPSLRAAGPAPAAARARGRGAFLLMGPAPAPWRGRGPSPPRG